jgi:hypothetical protein
MADDSVPTRSDTSIVTSSREADIAREIDQLIAKLVTGTATPQDRARLQELSERRSKLMRPAYPPRLEERRKRSLVGAH